MKDMEIPKGVRSLLDGLSRVDAILQNRLEVVEKNIGGRIIQTTQQKYTDITITPATWSKTDIVSQLYNKGMISDEEMDKYLLSDDWGFTPKIKSDE